MTLGRYTWQEMRKAACRHDFRVTRYDARTMDTAGNQYELEQCRFCTELRRGAIVHHAPRRGIAP